jgi:hypothetical protein
MTHPFFAAEYIKQHERELRTATARSRLIALAQCCKPSRLATLARTIRTRAASRRTTPTATTLRLTS